MITRAGVRALACGVASLALVAVACVGNDPGTAPAAPADGGASSGASGQASSSGGSSSSSSSGGSSSGGSSSSGAVDAGQAKIVFVTSTLFDGSLNGMGGVAGANAYCQQAAKAQNLPGANDDDAGTSGLYKAWLSTEMGDDPDTHFSRSAPGGYARTDGVMVAASWSDLVTGKLLAPIDHDEKGAPVPAESPFVWTNTMPSGATFSNSNLNTDCGLWMAATGAAQGLTGNAKSIDSTWTQNTFDPCSALRRLYCFQQ